MDIPITFRIFPTLQRSVYQHLPPATCYLLHQFILSFVLVHYHSVLYRSYNRIIANPDRNPHLLDFDWRTMKFGKSLSNQIEETLPEWQDKFLSYKELKKRLKLIEPNGGDASRASKRARLDPDDVADGVEYVMTKEEIDFIQLLEDELEKFNSFFVEKEEEYIIKLKELQDRVSKWKDSDEEIINIRKEIVDFHGEMVLLENYSALNYTGLVKILKKYDKRTGALIRLPFIQKVLQQPFFTTDLLYKLVKECEAMLDRLFPMKEPPSAVDAGYGDNGVDGCCDTSTSSTTMTEGCLRTPNALSEIEHVEGSYMKSTIAALRVLKEIRSGSSTVSVFSLPPLQVSGVADDWKKVPILEQVAK